MCVRSPAAAERRLQGRKVIFFLDLVTKAGNRAAPDLLGCGADLCSLYTSSLSHNSLTSLVPQL